MNRRSMMTLCVSLTLGACQVESPEDSTSTTEQAVSAFCGAVMPATPFWDGTQPKPAAGQIFLVFRDPDAAGEWIGVLADPGAKTLPWGARVKTQKLGTFVDTLSGTSGQLDVGRIVPHNPPVGPGGQPTFLLDWAALALPMQGQIQTNATCP